MKHIALFFALLGSAAAYSETLYVSDQLTLNLREGPSDTAAVLRPSLTSGDALEVLRRDDAGSEFLEVVTEDGRQGWVHGQYLVTTPIAQDRLQAAQERIVALEGVIAEQHAQLNALDDGGSGNAPADEALMAQIDGLGQQIEDLKGMLAQRDPSANGSPPGMIRTLRDYWPVLAFGFFVIGLAIGLILRARPKRDAWG